MREESAYIFPPHVAVLGLESARQDELSAMRVTAQHEVSGMAQKVDGVWFVPNHDLRQVGSLRLRCGLVLPRLEAIDADPLDAVLAQHRVLEDRNAKLGTNYVQSDRFALVVVMVSVSGEFETFKSGERTQHISNQGGDFWKPRIHKITGDNDRVWLRFNGKVDRLDCKRRAVQIADVKVREQRNSVTTFAFRPSPEPNRLAIHLEVSSLRNHSVAKQACAERGNAEGKRAKIHAQS